MYNLNYFELTAIEDANGEADPWNSPHVAGLKANLKQHFRTETEESCCYCRKNFVGEFAMVIDLEHVLPKHRFKQYMFEPRNLSVACKRCNMNIKGKRVDFLCAPLDSEDQHFAGDYYLLVHPNLDNFFDHLQCKVNIENEHKLIIYPVISEKGAFHYEYFKLKQLEIDSLNVAQGLPSITAVIENLPEHIASEIIQMI